VVSLFVLGAQCSEVLEVVTDGLQKDVFRGEVVGYFEEICDCMLRCRCLLITQSKCLNGTPRFNHVMFRGLF